MTARPTTIRRLGALGALGLCALVTTTGPALAQPAKPARAASGKTIVFRFYSRIQSFVYTRADGTVLPQPPQAGAAGDHFEITENGYDGTHASHSRKVVATSHTICVFKTAKGAPTCDGQGAVGGNQLLLFHQDGGSDDSTVTGGTGRYAGATGKVTAEQVGNTNDSDIVITVHLAK